jgi:hypothetical protein
MNDQTNVSESPGKTVQAKAYLGNSGESWVPRATNTSGVFPIRTDGILGRVIGAATCFEGAEGVAVVNLSIDKNTDVAFDLENNSRPYFLHVTFDLNGAIAVGVVSAEPIAKVRAGERTATGILYFTYDN